MSARAVIVALSRGRRGRDREGEPGLGPDRAQVEVLARRGDPPAGRRLEPQDTRRVGAGRDDLDRDAAARSPGAKSCTADPKLTETGGITSGLRRTSPFTGSDATKHRLAGNHKGLAPDGEHALHRYRGRVLGQPDQRGIVDAEHSRGAVLAQPVGFAERRAPRKRPAGGADRPRHRRPGPRRSVTSRPRPG